MPITFHRSIGLAGGLLVAGCAHPATPQSVAADLLAADSAFSAASAGTDAVTGLTAMLAADVTMPVPGGKFVIGAPAVAELLRTNPDNLQSRAEWTPVRVALYR